MLILSSEIYRPIMTFLKKNKNWFWQNLSAVRKSNRNTTPSDISQVGQGQGQF